MMLKAKDFSAYALDSMEDLRSELTKRQTEVYSSWKIDSDKVDPQELSGIILNLVVLVVSISILTHTGLVGRFEQLTSSKNSITVDYQDVSRVVK